MSEAVAGFVNIGSALFKHVVIEMFLLCVLYYRNLTSALSHRYFKRRQCTLSFHTVLLINFHALG